MSASSDDRVQFLIDLIAKDLDSFEAGEVGLARLVSVVENGIDGLLDVADRDWVDQLRSAWSGLEIVYAVALDEGREMLNDDERGDVRNTVAELRALLATGRH